MTEQREPGKPWSLIDAAKYLGLSVRSLERAASRGEITFRRIGRRILVPDNEVKRLAGFETTSSK